MSRRSAPRPNEAQPGAKAQGYRWIDKDPLLEEVIALIHADGRSLWAIARASNMTQTTLARWLDGKTKRPQAVSIRWVLRALGKELKIVDLQTETKAEKWRH